MLAQLGGGRAPIFQKTFFLKIFVFFGRKTFAGILKS